MPWQWRAEYDESFLFFPLKVTASGDQTAKVWDVRAGELLSTVLQLPAPTTVVANPIRSPCPCFTNYGMPVASSIEISPACQFFLPVLPCKSKRVSLVMDSAFITQRSCLFINLQIRLHQLQENCSAGHVV